MESVWVRGEHFQVPLQYQISFSSNKFIKDQIENCDYHFHNWVYVTYLGSDRPYGIRVRSFKVFPGIPNVEACILRRKS